MARKPSNGKHGTRAVDTAEVKRALAMIADPAHGVELRGLPSKRSRVLPAADLDGLASAAEELAGDRGIYYCLNPVPADMGNRAAKDDDVLYRRWLPLDIDPVRAKGHETDSATDGEKAEAWRLAAAVSDYLKSLGLRDPLVIDSGNGYHLLYAVLLPNDDPSELLVRSVILSLAARFNTEGAVIDPVVYNASRIMRLPGTWAQKGKG